MITCRLLGPVSVEVDGAEPPAELLWKKHLALLVYLALSPRRTRTREHLTGLLWGDKAEQAARHSLNEALRVLRKSVGDDRLLTDASSVSLAEGAVALDTAAFAEHEAAARWLEAAALVGGELVEGFSVPGESAFEDWLTAERGRWERRAVEALVRAADSSLAAGDTGAASTLAERAAALAPTSGPATACLLRALALAGHRAAALARFDDYAALLRERVGAAPDATVAGMAERIRKGQVGPAAGSHAARVATTRRLPLAGRAAEMQAMSASWQAVAGARRARVSVILADAGLGKTRLVEELANRVELDGGAVVAMRAVEADRATPWSGVVGLARGGLLAAPGIAGAPPQAHAGMAALVPEWVDHFPGVGKVEPAPPSRALAELLRAAGDERPVLVVADDSHFLDPDSLEALAALPRDLADAPLLLVLTAEPTTAPAALDALRARLGRDVPGGAIELGVLDLNALQDMARAVFPLYDEAAIARLGRRVLADSAGVPLLAIEILHGVAAGLDLHGERGEWPAPYHTLTQTSPGGLPDTVVAAIRIGFRRLTADAQRALSAAAALGGRVPAGQLEQATGLDRRALHAALDELEWQRWLAFDGQGYAFVAGIVERIVERDMLTPGQRKRIRDATKHAGHPE